MTTPAFVILIPFILLFLATLIALVFSRAHSLTPVRMGWLLALFPATSMATFAWLIVPIEGGQTYILSINWIPSAGINFSLYVDGLSALFSLLVTGIGALIMVYSGYYFEKEQGAWRFKFFLLLFMIAMLGVVMAGDLITLFIFWETTSITSFLLIAYKYKDEKARRGGFKSLFITGFGGIAMFVGMLLLAASAGGYDYKMILSHGDAVRNSPLYPAIVLLICLGAFTKSAQFPFHTWLPDAMNAPTPASGFLHSATMVKAGVYLLARLNPTLGYTDLWFWLLSGVGLVTMVGGAYLGFKQNDLKALLAFSTISQLGALVALIGQDTSIAFKALVISLIAHALYKSALFLITGIVDHKTGTRDIRKLGGLSRTMPWTFTVASLAALSMAGLPPLFGFLAKETLLATAVHPNIPKTVEALFPTLIVISGALILAQAGLFVYATFLGKPANRKQPPNAHDPSKWMLLAPAFPALISLALGALPEPKIIALFLAQAASDAYGDTVKVSLALWNGINVPLVLGVVAINLGIALFLARNRLRPVMQAVLPHVSSDKAYNTLMAIIDRLAMLTTRLQAGYLRLYLTIMLVGVGLLLLIFRALPLSFVTGRMSSSPLVSGSLEPLRILVLVLAVLSALASVFMRRDIVAILAMGISGLTLAIWMALEPAPDVALVQVTVDLLTTVILVLLLVRLPRRQRMKAWELTFRQSRQGLLRDALVALGSGLVVAALIFIALSTRPRPSQVSTFYEANAKSLTGARDIVSAILVDFRGLDTLFEIAVFASGGIGIYMLLHYAARKVGDREDPDPALSPGDHPISGVSGVMTSPLLRFLAYALLPLAIILAIIQIMYGHDQPGDGFTAGVFVSLGLEFWYIIFGYHSTKKQIPWLRPAALIGVGLFIALANGLLSALFANGFMTPINYGQLFRLPLPEGFSFSSSFLFELAICLVVLGSATLILDNLGRPKEEDVESDSLLAILDQEQGPSEIA